MINADRKGRYQTRPDQTRRSGDSSGDSSGDRSGDRSGDGSTSGAAIHTASGASYAPVGVCHAQKR